MVGTALYKTEHPASDDRVTNKTVWEVNFDEEVLSLRKMTIYNNNLYLIGVKDGSLVISKDMGITFTTLLNAGGTKTGALIQDFATTEINYMVVSDFVVNENGVYILLSSVSTQIKKSMNNESRGALVILDHDFSSAKTIGWTNTKHMLSSSSYIWALYQPKSIKDGFYGPRKILAIKPKELVLSDDGAYIYPSGSTNAFGKGDMNHLVYVDLETLSYDAVETDFDFLYNVSISGNDGGQCNYVETWE